MNKRTRGKDFQGSFFTYKGIKYEMVEEYEKEGRRFIKGLSADGKECIVEAIFRKEKIGAHNQSTT